MFLENCHCYGRHVTLSTTCLPTITARPRDFSLHYSWCSLYFSLHTTTRLRLFFYEVRRKQLRMRACFCTHIYSKIKLCYIASFPKLNKTAANQSSSRSSYQFYHSGCYNNDNAQKLRSPQEQKCGAKRHLISVRGLFVFENSERWGGKSSSTATRAPRKSNVYIYIGSRP